MKVLQVLYLDQQHYVVSRQDKDLIWLETPIVFDMRHDRLEERPLRGDNGTSPWPADAGPQLTTAEGLQVGTPEVAMHAPNHL